MVKLISNIDSQYKTIETSLATCKSDERMEILISEKSYQEDDNFLTSYAYNFYMNTTAGKENVNKNYYTEDELIHEIQRSNEPRFHEYYGHNYFENKRVYSAVIEKMLSMKKQLETENIKLKEKIEEAKKC